jgi:phosphopantothenoylcysteine synthetase/decarboxylase
MTLKGKKILLGMTGGIAAYKAAELTRLFVKNGADVRVVMTEAATRFVGTATMQALSGQRYGATCGIRGSAMRWGTSNCRATGT